MIRGDSIKTALLLYPFCKDDMKKLVQGMKDVGRQVDIYDIREEQPEISEYERIGIISGIYAFQSGKPLMKYLQKHLPYGKEVFVIYTYEVYQAGCAGAIRDLIGTTNSIFLGEYGCLGFDSFGPFKVFGPALNEAAVGQEIREYAKQIIRILAV